MSYNLMAEGDLDLYELGQHASSYAPLELFPIPGVDPPDGLGIAIARTHRGPEAIAALRALIEALWLKNAAVVDLYTGERIDTEDDLADLEERING